MQSAQNVETRSVCTLLLSDIPSPFRMHIRNRYEGSPLGMGLCPNVSPICPQAQALHPFIGNPVGIPPLDAGVREQIVGNRVSSTDGDVSLPLPVEPAEHGLAEPDAESDRRDRFLRVAAFLRISIYRHLDDLLFLRTTRCAGLRQGFPLLWRPLSARDRRRDGSVKSTVSGSGVRQRRSAGRILCCRAAHADGSAMTDLEL